MVKQRFPGILNHRMLYAVRIGLGGPEIIAIKEATGQTIPPMPGSSRFKGPIFQTIEGIFSKTELLTFENPLTFPEVKPFIDYVRASLSEDRKLWTSMFNGKDEYEALIGKIEAVATSWFDRDGKLVMTKVVGGILATK